MANRQRGTVKWFDPQKGYGFIEPDRGDDDVFIHISEVPGDDLDDGERLEFEVKHTDKGLNAVQVRRLDGSTAAPRPNVSASAYRLPRDTATLLENGASISNLALRLEKIVEFGAPDDTPDVPDDFSFARFDPSRLQARHDAHLAAIRGRPGVTVREVRAEVDWRLAVGLGQASVYENGITLDPVDGVPYVPGSGVKGALRTFLVNAVYRSQLDDPTDEDGHAEEKALDDPLFRTLFGTSADAGGQGGEAQRGAVAFHDAYPSDPPTVEADIMNPHYQTYYQGTDDPTDDMNPTIITFPTVRDATFTFAVSTRENEAPSAGVLLKKTPPKHRGSRLDLVTHWLRRLLTEYGLGSKTAVGYGYFEVAEAP